MRAATTIGRGPVRRATRRPPGRLDSHKNWTDRRGRVTIPGGSANAYDYADQNPSNQTDLGGDFTFPGCNQARCDTPSYDAWVILQMTFAHLHKPFDCADDLFCVRAVDNPQTVWTDGTYIEPSRHQGFLSGSQFMASTGTFLTFVAGLADVAQLVLACYKLGKFGAAAGALVPGFDATLIPEIAGGLGGCVGGIIAYKGHVNLTDTGFGL